MKLISKIYYISFFFFEIYYLEIKNFNSHSAHIPWRQMGQVAGIGCSLNTWYKNVYIVFYINTFIPSNNNSNTDTYQLS